MIRRLGAELLEYTIAPGDAIAGARVRDLGLPRDAAVTVIVRDERAIAPRGSTRLRDRDDLHLMIREELADLIPHSCALEDRADRTAAAATAA